MPVDIIVDRNIVYVSMLRADLSLWRETTTRPFYYLGWLEHPSPIPQREAGESDSEFEHALQDIMAQPLFEVHSGGTYICSYCMAAGRGDFLAPSAKILIGRECGYFVPDALIHLVTRHGYLPPQRFVDDVFWVRGLIPAELGSLRDSIRNDLFGESCSREGAGDATAPTTRSEADVNPTKITTTGREETVPDLIALLASTAPHDQVYAAIRLSHYDEPRVVDALVERIESSSSEDVRATAIEAISEHSANGFRAVRALCTCLRDPSSNVRIWAAMALGRIDSGDIDPSPWVEPLVDDPHPGCRVAAQGALASIRKRQAL